MRRQVFFASESMTALGDDGEYQLPRPWVTAFYVQCLQDLRNIWITRGARDQRDELHTALLNTPVSNSAREWREKRG